MRDDALLGRVLDGRYRIGERIARGGMASVFLGHDERLDRAVAIKVMHAGLGDDEEFSQRFEREARAAAKLNHRGVVAVFDQGRDGDVTYLVMEYVPGRTLRDVMRAETPMAPLRALRLLAEVLTALSAAHRAHLVHRDVKPENVLITPDGEVKVADFGLARAVSAATTATGGTLIGTVSYLAPEIVVNEGADARSDVYACGALLYEMLTGVKPHTGESPIQVAYKHVHEDVAAPSVLRPELPPYVDALVARATVRDRSQRSQDAGVLLRQVRLVERALADGLVDDPDLTADLRPRAVVADEEPTRPVVLEHEYPDGALSGPVSPAAAAALDDDGGETVLVDRETGEVVARAEPTMRWSSEAWSAQRPATGTPAGPPPDPRRPVDDDGRARRRGRVLLVAAVLAVLLVGGLGWWLGIGRYAEVPQLVGQAEAQAAEQAKADGFAFDVTRRAFSETAPLGTVLSTDPAAGGRLLPGDTIHAVVSKGKERYAVPDVQGRTVDEARAAFDELTLQVGDVTEAFSEKIPEGQVIRASGYKFGQQVKRGTVVDLVVSKGREPVDVADQTGKPREEAVKALEGASFRVTVTEEFSDDVDEGTVISQSPDEGTGFRGDTITLVVSKGPENVDVPDVTGRPRDEAVKVLEEAGFEVDVKNRIPGTDRVVFQEPGSGKAKVGSTVVIYV
jgi:serine/threonine-protein kinase